MASIERAEALGALDDEFDVLASTLRSLTEDELLEPSACRGWNVVDVVFHTLLDLQRALVTFHAPATAAPDVDFASYWRGFTSDDEAASAHARFVRAVTAAHHAPETVVARWLETAGSVRRAAPAVAHAAVETQGHVLALPDFLATLVVEATVHHLDLTANLTAKPEPAPAALAVTTKTLDALLGARRPAGWEGVTYVLKATGRAALTPAERDHAGARVPAFS